MYYSGHTSIRGLYPHSPLKRSRESTFLSNMKRCVIMPNYISNTYSSSTRIKLVPDMPRDKVCSPDPETAPTTTYYSHSLNIQTYQNMLFLHVYVAPSQGKEKTSHTYAHVIDINIKHAQAGDGKIYRNYLYVLA